MPDVTAMVLLQVPECMWDTIVVFVTGNLAFVLHTVKGRNH